MSYVPPSREEVVAHVRAPVRQAAHHGRNGRTRSGLSAGNPHGAPEGLGPVVEEADFPKGVDGQLLAGLRE
eukprot:8556999-Lingulodinium_polyedra.AAC.1